MDLGATDLCHPIATLTRHLCLWVWFKLCVINACCVFVSICYESNVCVWPCCSPDPLLVSVHITQFSANWITIYCFISLEHHLLLYSIGSSIHHMYKSITQLLTSLQIGSPSAIAFKVFISGFQMLSTFISTFSIQINPCKKGKTQGFTDIKLFVDLYLPIYISWAHEHELVFHLRVTTR